MNVMHDLLIFFGGACAGALAALIWILFGPVDEDF